MSADTFPFNITLKTLAGDLLTIEVDLNDTIQNFPLHFAREMGYNPKTIHRFEFMVHPECEEEPFRLMDHSKHSWLELFPTPEDIPILHFLVQSENEKDIESKIDLIRSIVEKERLKCPLSDEEIASHYHQWYLTYLPPTKSNRYITLSDFVHQSSHLFPVYSREEIYAIQMEYDECKRELDHAMLLNREKQRTIGYYENVLSLQKHARYAMNKIAQFTPVERELHEAHKAELQTLLKEDPDCLFVHQQPEKINTYKGAVTTYVMLEMGIYNAGYTKESDICDCDASDTKKRCSSKHLKAGKELLDILAEYRSELADVRDTVLLEKLKSLRENRYQFHQEQVRPLENKLHPLRRILSP